MSIRQVLLAATACLLVLGATQAHAADHPVFVDTSFTPRFVEVRPGDTVTWHWIDGFFHH